MNAEGLYQLDLSVITAAALLCMLGGAEVARALGRRQLVRAGGARMARVEVFEGALLGLTSLMIGFTFSLALNRFEQRKAVVLAEANAVGTVSLRGRLLPAPHAAEVARLIRRYADARLALGAAPYGSRERRAAIDTSLHVQEQLWREASASTQRDPRSVPAGLFAAAVNDLVDAHTARLTADRNHVPAPTLLLLYGIAAMALGFAAYASAVSGTRNRVSVAIMALTIATVIALIVDLDRPRRGLVTVSQRPMEETRAGM